MVHKYKTRQGSVGFWWRISKSIRSGHVDRPTGDDLPESIRDALVYAPALKQKTPTVSARVLVENIGVEPMTSCMPCKRSSQLS
jgi:hypothetical protein